MEVLRWKTFIPVSREELGTSGFFMAPAQGVCFEEGAGRIRVPMDQLTH